MMWDIDQMKPLRATVVLSLFTPSFHRSDDAVERQKLGVNKERTTVALKYLITVFKLGRSINVKTIPLYEFWEYYFFSLLYSWKKVIQFLIVLSKMAPVFYMFTQKNTEIQSSRMLTFWKVTPQDDHFNLYNLLRPT